MLPLPATTIQPRWERPEQLAVARLFAADRDLEERVRPDDWHPTAHRPEIVALDAHHTVAKRRRWYRTLRAAGEPTSAEQWGVEGGGNIAPALDETASG